MARMRTKIWDPPAMQKPCQTLLDHLVHVLCLFHVEWIELRIPEMQERLREPKMMIPSLNSLLCIDMPSESDKSIVYMYLVYLRAK